MNDMQFKVSEIADAVGWKEAESSAPRDVMDFAKKSSEAGIPTAIAKIRHESQPVNSGSWAVIQGNEKGIYVGYRYQDPIAAVEVNPVTPEQS